MSKVQELLSTKKISTENALKMFDELSPVGTDFMIGRWKGTELDTEHQLDGLLSLSGWYGKLFISTEEVHPLLFYTNNKKTLYAVNPRFIPLNKTYPKLKTLGFLMRLLKPILKTKKSKARLRMVEYRGKTTATMIYDNKPIHDHFVKIDNDTVLGCMDLKNAKKPYFWILKRDDSSTFNFQF